MNIMNNESLQKIKYEVYLFSLQFTRKLYAEQLNLEKELQQQLAAVYYVLIFLQHVVSLFRFQLTNRFNYPGSLINRLLVKSQ